MTSGANLVSIAKATSCKLILKACQSPGKSNANLHFDMPLGKKAVSRIAALTAGGHDNTIRHLVITVENSIDHFWKIGYVHF